MKTITFYSYKGGVGRSLTLSNIAMRLADLGKKVCVLDFDLEAPGLHLKFKDYIEEKSNSKKGIVEFISEFQNQNILHQNIDDFTIETTYKGALKGGCIKLIPAGNYQEETYWKDLSSINWKDLFYSEESNGVNLFLHLKEIIKSNIKPDFLLIDSRTGITDISGLAMTLLADSVVVLAANNTENIYGASRVIKNLKKEENNLIGKLPEITFVLSRIPYYDSPEKKHIETRIINEAFSTINRKEQLIDKIFVIHSDRDLEEKEKFKINLVTNENSTKGRVPIVEDYLTLFEHLTKHDLDAAEINTFNNFRESQLLIEEAKGINDFAIKINTLNQAVKLNNKSDEAYGLLAQSFNEIANYQESLKNVEKAIKLAPDNLNYQYTKALTLKNDNKPEDSKKILTKILSVKANHYSALITLANIYYNNKEYDDALKYQILITNFFPEYPGGYNSVGNTYRAKGNYDKAFEYIYKCLEISPKDVFGTGTLGEIYAALDNDREFFKNLQLSFVFGMDAKTFQRIIEEEDIYKKYYSNTKFIDLLKSYRIKINFPK